MFSLSRFLPGFLLAAFISSRGEPPALSHIYPAGAARSSTNLISLTGKFEPWPPKVWVEGPGVTFLAETNKGKFQVQVAADAKIGPRLVRLYNEEGASEPRTFVIGDGAEAVEAEPNDNFRKPQTPSSFPVTINGRLDKSGDVDCFAINVPAGHWLDARVDAYTLMSRIDAVLRLVDSRGYQIEWNHDWNNLDPRLVWRSPEPKTVIVQIFGFVYPANAEIQLTGGESAVYRLHLAVSPQPPADINEAPGESEPNDAPGGAKKIELPTNLLGAITSALDEDRFSFEAKKDEVFAIQVEAADMGSPLDALLKVEDVSGKEITRNDDADNTRDPRIEWKAPGDGAHLLSVSSLTHRGGQNFRYRLRAEKLSPAIAATIGASSFVLTAGTTNEIKFSANRLRGFTNEVTASIQGLPGGASCAPVTVSDKSGEVVLRLIGETNAAAFSGPVRIALTESTTKTNTFGLVDFKSSSVDNGVPGGFTKLLVETTDQLWLTVRPKPPEPTKPEDKKAAGGN